MKKIAYLTMADMGEFVTDFHLSIPPMLALGWQVETVAWRTPTDWNRYDAVYICTPWDYPEHVRQFLAVLAEIDASDALLINDLALVHWNLEKTYLRDIEARGGSIVPSSWHDGFQSPRGKGRSGAGMRDLFAGLFADFGTERLVIKPTVGANAQDIVVLTRPLDEAALAGLREIYTARPFFVQPFIESIVSDGEFSLFFFNGEYSHAIQKTPLPGDFRVQEEHGASIAAVEPARRLLDTATALFAEIEPLPAYGRGDWVLDDEGRYRLMELELIEPSLYLRTDGRAAARFARGLDQRFKVFAGK